MGLFFIAGCSSSSGLFSGSVSEQFSKALSNFDAYCKRSKIGPYLDSNDPESRRRAAVRDCDILSIKPFDLNAALATPEGKFAYSLQLPPPFDKPRVKRSDYRSAEEYFDALCQREAGETVFRKIDAVDGVAVLRAYPDLFPKLLGSYSEESTIVGGGAAPEDRLLLSPPQFRFIERPLRPDEQRKFPHAKYFRFEKDQANPTKLLMRPIDQLSARFAYTWRGTPNLDDRKNGIFGGELLTVDRQTGEILGIRRSFTKDEVDLRYQDRIKLLSLPCPNPNRTDYSQFLKDNLIPTNAKH